MLVLLFLSTNDLELISIIKKGDLNVFQRTQDVNTWVQILVKF